tara:strand:+ start:401 stop:637 length:237 start_codon:yes stop_codon:yes gene_type:complete
MSDNFYWERNINPRVKTEHSLHDSNGQLRVRAISNSCMVLKVGDPEFMCVFMEEDVALDLIEQIEDAVKDMKERKDDA